MAVSDSKRDITEKIRDLEERILYLESVSPEYFSGAVSRICFRNLFQTFYQNSGKIYSLSMDTLNNSYSICPRDSGPMVLHIAYR